MRRRDARRRAPDAEEIVHAHEAVERRSAATQRARVGSAPNGGILHAGCYPSGSDELAEAVTSAFRDASFYADAKSDIMRWKYRKLLANLGNAVDALC